MEREVPKIKSFLLAAIWLEALLYGVYVYVFTTAIPLFKQRSIRKSFSLKMIILGNCLIFLLASSHSVLNTCLLTVAFAYQAHTENPFDVNTKSGRLTHLSAMLLDLIMWIGDLLGIYRSFLIWGMNYQVIAIPVLLSLTCSGLHWTNVYWSRNIAFTDFNIPGRPLLIIPLSILCLQNILTSGLVVAQIWTQHRRSREANLRSFSTPRLGPVMRILIESSAIYTIGMSLLLVLMSIRHPAWYIVYCSLGPLTGIVFLLVLLRTNAVIEEAKKTAATGSLFSTHIFARALVSRSNAGIPKPISMHCTPALAAEESTPRD